MNRTQVIFISLVLLFSLIFAISTRSKSVELVTDAEIAFHSYVTNPFTDWAVKIYIPLDPFEGVVSGLSTVKIKQGELLSGKQRDTLTNSIATWWKAYHAGSKEAYLGFRFPTGVPWKWKNDSLQQMSNYFYNGTYFSSFPLMDAWMRNYGHPDNITNLLPYALGAKDSSTQDLHKSRERWVKDYGDGTRSKTAYRPIEPFDQWSTIAYNYSRNNWWSNYWTGVCLDEMIIQVTATSKVPRPLYTDARFYVERSSCLELPVRFHMELSRIQVVKPDRQSFIEWNVTYGDIIKKQGEALTADVFCIFRSEQPNRPHPVLLRLVYINEFAKWVPMEMVTTHVTFNHNYELYF